MKKLKFFGYAIAFFSIVQIGFSCKTLITTYDQYSYTQLSSVKVEVLNMMDKAESDYSSNEKDIIEVIKKVEKAKEYDSHKPNNEIMASMWIVLYERINSNSLEGVSGHQYPKGFFPKWKSEKKQSEIFIKEAKLIIADLFDLILDLESKKLKEAEAQSAFNKIKDKISH